MEKSSSISNHCISTHDVSVFAEVTGDWNPIHFGENAIVHGCLVLGRVSAEVWKVVGNGVIAREIECLKMRRSVKPGEPFTISIGSPEPINGSRFGEYTVAAKVTKTAEGRERTVAEGVIVVIPPS